MLEVRRGGAFRALGEVGRNDLEFRVAHHDDDREQGQPPLHRQVERHALRADVELAPLAREQNPVVGGGHDQREPRTFDAASTITTTCRIRMTACSASRRRRNCGRTAREHSTDAPARNAIGASVAISAKPICPSHAQPMGWCVSATNSRADSRQYCGRFAKATSGEIAPDTYSAKTAISASSPARALSDSTVA